MTATLEVDGLILSRGGRRVLHGVSLRVAPGEVVALLGANGAGKSSLVMACVGALPTEAGSIRFAGQPLVGLSPDRVRARGLAVVAEGHRVLGGLTVRENLDVAAMMHPARAASAIVDEALALLPELRLLLSQPAGTLSGGQKQMVAIAQALVARPRLLLIDELSLGLAPVVVARLVTALKEVAARGVGILLVEQFTTLALSVASRATLLALGRVVWDGPAAALAADPGVLHRAYLGAA